MMDPSKLFVDGRHASFCPYCGGRPDTTDHVPPRIMLDDPLPPDLAVVRACHECNNTHSADEAYLAGLLESIACGSTQLDGLSRPKVRRMFLHEPSLHARITAAQDSRTGRWLAENERIMRVVLKLARGHATYELGETFISKPDDAWCAPYPTLTSEQVASFEHVAPEVMCPEIGSRAFMRMYAIAGTPHAEFGWQVVQAGRYRYVVTHSGTVRVRIVLSEYLACEVGWGR